MEQKRSLVFDENTQKYVLEIVTEDELKSEDKTVGSQISTIKQVYDKDQLELIKSNIQQQKEDFEKKKKQTEIQLKNLPKFTEREENQIKEFSDKLQKVRDYTQRKQLEDALKSADSILEKINKDLSELDVKVD